MNASWITCSPESFDESIFRLIGTDWTLLSAGTPEKVNTMTASWGGVGIFWGKPAAICLIRPQRYTYELVEQQDRLSFSFLSEEYRPALRWCGSHSGRDGDKFAACGLTPAFSEQNVPYIREASTVFLCRKLYADDLRKGCFLEAALPDLHYAEGDYHRFYICEIEEIRRAVSKTASASAAETQK